MFCIIYSSVEYIILSPPKILSSKSTDCGSAITVEWGAPPITGPGVNSIFGYELTLRSASGKSRWNYSVPRDIAILASHTANSPFYLKVPLITDFTIPFFL